MHWWTKRGEIERILTRGGVGAPHTVGMTVEFAGALRASRKLAGQRVAILEGTAAFDPARLAHEIVTVKGMNLASGDFSTV